MSTQNCWNESQASQWLDSRMIFGIKAGLENITELCRRLNHPERSFKTVHVVGTNGKGSTSFWLASVLSAHGISCGLFTSPHLVSVRERIRLGDKPISTTDFARLVSEVASQCENGPILEVTFFEVLTAVAFLWFQEQGVEFVVLEAGLGGRLDSTAVAQGEWTILTSVGLDHMEILGHSLQQIFFEKIGIWNRGYLFHILQEEFGQKLSEHPHQTTLLPAQWQNDLVKRQQKIHGQLVQVKCRNDLQLLHRGVVYHRNASLALAVAECILGSKYQDSTAKQILCKKIWWGRVQVLENPQSQKVQWILDGAHNGHAAKALAESLTHIIPPQEKIVLVMGVLKTKNPQEILEPLLPWIKELHWTRTSHEKMRDPQDLQKFSQEQGISSFAHSCVASCLENVQNKAPILCTGSLYLIGAVIHELCFQYDNLQWFRQFQSLDDNEH